jgi:hypothetical protein
MNEMATPWRVQDYSGIGFPGVRPIDMDINVDVDMDMDMDMDLTEHGLDQVSHEKKTDVQINTKLSMESLSIEQQAVVKSVLQGQNTQVIAKAGTGKTTVSLSTVYQYHTKYRKRGLILTYNAKLKEECRHKIKTYGMQDYAEAHSYHAAAWHLFFKTQNQNQEAITQDAVIHDSLQVGPPQPFDFGLIVIDEAQDLTDLYVQLVQHILRKCANPPVILIMGDPFQRIFGFSQSKSDYLLSPQEYFGTNDKFHVFHLSICWRITHEMADFVNRHVNPHTFQHTHPKWWAQNGHLVTAWWGSGIKANPARPASPQSVEYHTVSTSSQVSHYHHISANYVGLDRSILELIQAQYKKYGQDVTMLCFSIKTCPHIKACVNELSKLEHENWLVMDENYVESSDKKKLTQNKRIISTIHKYKGMEQRCCIVVGFNFIPILDSPNPLDQFNLWYVAATRAKEKLILVHFQGEEYTTISGVLHSAKKDTPTKLDVTDIYKYIPFNLRLSLPHNLFRFHRWSIDSGEALKSQILNQTITCIKGRNNCWEDMHCFLGTAIHFKLSSMIDPKFLQHTIDCCLQEFFLPHDLKFLKYIKNEPPLIANDPAETRYNAFQFMKDTTNAECTRKNFHKNSTKHHPDWFCWTLNDLCNIDELKDEIAHKYSDHEIDMFMFLLNISQKSTLTWQELIKLSICREVTKSKLRIYWRQLHRSIDKYLPVGGSYESIMDQSLINCWYIIGFILVQRGKISRAAWVEAITHSVLDADYIQMLAPHIRTEGGIVHNFDLSWFTVNYSHVTGSIDLVIDGEVLLEIKNSSQLHLDHMLQAQMYHSLSIVNHKVIQKSQYADHNKTNLVLIANLGELYQIDLMFPGPYQHEEFIYRMLARKCLRNDQSYNLTEYLDVLYHQTPDQPDNQ